MLLVPKERCIAKPETYAQRAERRTAEISGLKQALSVLEDETALVQKRKKGGANALCDTEGSPAGLCFSAHELQLQVRFVCLFARVSTEHKRPQGADRTPTVVNRE